MANLSNMKPLCTYNYCFVQVCVLHSCTCNFGVDTRVVEVMYTDTYTDTYLLNTQVDGFRLNMFRRIHCGATTAGLQWAIRSLAD